MPSTRISQDQYVFRCVVLIVLICLSRLVLLHGRLLQQLMMMMDSSSHFWRSNSNISSNDRRNDTIINSLGEGEKPNPFASRILNLSEHDNLIPLKGEKIINFYTSFKNLGGSNLVPGRKDFYEMKCPVRNCFVISDPNYTNADAYLLYSTELKPGLINSTRLWRRPNQAFIFVQTESPQIGLHENLSLYSRFFNYTLTYRPDSDFRFPHGWFQPMMLPTTSSFLHDPFFQYREDRAKVPWPVVYDEARFRTNELPILKSRYSRILLERPHKAAWVVSNCQDTSRRRSLIQSLIQYFPDIDVYGRKRCIFSKIAPTRKCTGGTTWSDTCVPNMKRQYKFYFALENSLCNGYVTEKFFNRIFDNYLVVVLGQANYSHFAPPHTYINALDFKSIKDLAQYLHYLNNNDTAYLSYFWWKKHYLLEISHRRNLNKGYCELCAELNKAKPLNKVYNDIQGWWETKSDCGRDLPKVDALIETA